MSVFDDSIAISFSLAKICISYDIANPCKLLFQNYNKVNLRVLHIETCTSRRPASVCCDVKKGKQANIQGIRTAPGPRVFC